MRKKVFTKIGLIALAGMIISAVLFLLGINDGGACALAATFLIPTDSGVAEHGGEGSTVEFTNEHANELIRKSLNPKILKIEPYNFFADSLLRYEKTRVFQSKTQEYQYYTYPLL
ncbi:MAG: hypothetical protein LBC68_05240 [Prevotellaceae bacterium]|jgi:hypothetical protein|nr:hypothetical protein [Prevotellaceae bacterium]